MTSIKQLMSRAPNVTVVVGSGDNAREFQCYGAILAPASPVLDAMLSSGMKESENKNERSSRVGDGAAVYGSGIFSSISESNGLWSHLQTRRKWADKQIKRKDVSSLVWWARDLYSMRCDFILHGRAKELRDFSNNVASMHAREVIELLLHNKLWAP